ncbi:WD repeat-containing protein 75 [Eumeta japonica]|uniref:WD repeat-containing protein 75 n=1 Tax=Eumeta variegata TaxID=151549 RepID=A0A4C1XT92_EUMVA|nr:WD repeat-containing protein 75 [Eumeta japonica]
MLHEYDLNIQYHNIISVAVGWCQEERFAAICNGTKALYIQNLAHPHLKSLITNYNAIRILNVTAHAKESCIAITDALGRAFVLRGNFYKEKEVAREVMHWHCLPLLASAFSLQGSYLVTGGLESVLVKWTVGNLANHASEKKFIPRLPGTIRYITTDNVHLAATLNNNSVIIATTANMRIISTILECGGLSPMARALGPSLVYHRPLGALLLGGRPGHLQLYSTTTDKVLYNVDITQLNSIPLTRENLLPIDTEVNCIAVSADGSWLVTSEYRNDGISYPQERLKFWSYLAKEGNPFVLNTCVNFSHSGCKVVSISLNNIGDFCVSAGEDQKLRIWKRELNIKQKIFWNCITACYYSTGIRQALAHGILNNFKNTDMHDVEKKSMPYLTEVKKNDVVEKLINIKEDNSLIEMINVNAGIEKNDGNDVSGVAISQDGSLIAAWFGYKLTLWDTYLGNLRTTLSHPALRPRGMDVKFGNDDAAHYLACTTEDCLAVWSILSLTIRWIVRLQPSCLAADPFSNKMAVVTRDNDVFVFTPHSSTPLIKKEALVPPSTGILKQCCFAASRGDSVRLYMTKNDSDIYCLEPLDVDDARLEVISQKNVPMSNFSMLLAERQASGIRAPQTSDDNYLSADTLGKAALAQFMSAAPHMMPSVSLLCTTFLEHISGGQETKPDDEDQNTEDMEVDVESDDEEEQIIKEDDTYSSSHPILWQPSYEQTDEKRIKKILNDSVLHDTMLKSLFEAE